MKQIPNTATKFSHRINDGTVQHDVRVPGPAIIKSRFNETASLVEVILLPETTTDEHDLEYRDIPLPDDQP